MGRGGRNKMAAVPGPDRKIAIPNPIEIDERPVEMMGDVDEAAESDDRG